MDAKRILVVGDAMLDRYWDGVVDRISPEAPVPVLRVTRRYDRAGGAANVAMNLAALGARVTLIALVGIDSAADSLARLLADAGVDFVRITHPDYATTEKIRCVSRRHQMLRADVEMAPPAAMRDTLAGRFHDGLPAHDLVVLSDYGKGALAVGAPLIEAARALATPVLVDPKGRDWARYAGATLLKPNLAELEAVLGEVADDAQRHLFATALRHRLALKHLVVTRGDAGMTLFDDAGVTHDGALVREVHDVSGAGDTVMAALAWRLGEGDDAARAMRWANVAGSLAVQKFGTAIVTRGELVAAMETVDASRETTPCPR
ncbi:MAG: PfkB family carbohydrate kinase [Betaproteobacteria bacterium]